jgi:hypothetical protein
MTSPAGAITIGRDLSVTGPQVQYTLKIARLNSIAGYRPLTQLWTLIVVEDSRRRRISELRVPRNRQIGFFGGG